MKKLLFGMAFFMGAMMFTSLEVQAEEDIWRWKNMPCLDGSGGTYEICWLTGDGIICDTYAEQTRYCSPIIDPPIPE